MGAHEPRHRVAVGNADRIESLRGSRHDEFFGMGGAVEETEIARHGEFGKARVHSKMPCRNQHGPSSPLL